MLIFFPTNIYQFKKLSIVQYVIYISEAKIISAFLLKDQMSNLQPKAEGQVTNLRDMFTLFFLKCTLCRVFYYKFLDSKCVTGK